MIFACVIFITHAKGHDPFGIEYSRFPKPIKLKMQLPPESGYNSSENL